MCALDIRPFMKFHASHINPPGTNVLKNYCGHEMPFNAFLSLYIQL